MIIVSPNWVFHGLPIISNIYIYIYLQIFVGPTQLPPISPKPETRRILHHSTEVLKVGTSTIMTSDHRGQRVNVANLSRLVEARHRQLFHRKGFGSSFKRFLGWLFFLWLVQFVLVYIINTYMYTPSIFSEGCCFLKS